MTTPRNDPAGYGSGGVRDVGDRSSLPVKDYYMWSGPTKDYPRPQALMSFRTWAEALRYGSRATPGEGCRIICRITHGKWVVYRELKG